ncbi:MAG: hypothetical protein M3Z30_01545, partial [Gemmatimonadota bacterium]|nr:hypothetical protein [Gemmatimonadota bacterium]
SCSECWMSIGRDIGRFVDRGLPVRICLVFFHIDPELNWASVPAATSLSLISCPIAMRNVAPTVMIYVADDAG